MAISLDREIICEMNASFFSCPKWLPTVKIQILDASGSGTGHSEWRPLAVAGEGI